MNVWLGITSDVFKGGRQIYIQMKACVLPLKNVISFLNLANFFINYVKEPPCTQSTPSSCRCSQWELINTTLWRNKNKYECLIEYNFRSFQGRPTYLYPNESLCSPLEEWFLNLANFFINYVKEPPCTQSKLPKVGTNQHYLVKK